VAIAESIATIEQSQRLLQSPPYPFGAKPRQHCSAAEVNCGGPGASRRS
jgi:hypothetical protein